MENNISKLFYKDYYQDVDFHYVLDGKDPDKNMVKNSIGKMNKKIKESILVKIPRLSCVTHSFSAKIAYPGLITGTGLVHDSKKLDGAFNLGMHFDYTFGMPIVYGSSVKGVLCRYFKEFYKGEIDKEKLQKDIFSGEASDGTNKSIYKRDIFFDAVILKPYMDEKKIPHLLEDDSITPHTEGPLKNPTPITMLKIAPGCEIEFRFQLHDSVVDGLKFSVEDKQELFKEILKTVGIGAKTNVGYGQLEECQNLNENTVSGSTSIQYPGVKHDFV